VKRNQPIKKFESLQHTYKQEQKRLDYLDSALKRESQLIKSMPYSSISQLHSTKMNVPTLYKRYQDCSGNINRIMLQIEQCKNTLRQLSHTILCYNYPVLAPIFKSIRYLVSTATTLFSNAGIWYSDSYAKTLKTLLKKDTTKILALSALTTGVIAAFTCISSVMKAPWLIASAVVYEYIFFASRAACIATLGLLTLVKMHCVLYPTKKQNKVANNLAVPIRSEKKRVLHYHKYMKSRITSVRATQSIKKKKPASNKQGSKKLDDVNQIILRQKPPRLPCITQALCLSTMGFFCSTAAMYLVSIGSVKIYRYQEMITS